MPSAVGGLCTVLTSERQDLQRSVKSFVQSNENKVQLGIYFCFANTLAGKFLVKEYIGKDCI